MDGSYGYGHFVGPNPNDSGHNIFLNSWDSLVVSRFGALWNVLGIWSWSTNREYEKIIIGLKRGRIHND